MSQRTVTEEITIAFSELRDLFEAAGYDTSESTKVSMTIYQDGQTSPVDIDPARDKIFIHLTRTIVEDQG